MDHIYRRRFGVLLFFYIKRVCKYCVGGEHLNFVYKFIVKRIANSKVVNFEISALICLGVPLPAITIILL